MRKRVLGAIFVVFLPLLMVVAPSMAAAISDFSTKQKKAKHRVTELVVLDGSIENKAPFYRQQQPHIGIVELSPYQNGQKQLCQILKRYSNLSAIHIISPANDGEIQLGNAAVTQSTLHQQPQLLRVLKKSLRRGGDVMFYGSNVAASAKGNSLLMFIKQATQLDMAASSDMTGNVEQGGDWQLEVQRGQIDTPLLADPRTLYDFDEALLRRQYL